MGKNSASVWKLESTQSEDDKLETEWKFQSALCVIGVFSTVPQTRCSQLECSVEGCTFLIKVTKIDFQVSNIFPSCI